MHVMWQVLSAEWSQVAHGKHVCRQEANHLGIVLLPDRENTLRMDPPEPARKVKIGKVEIFGVLKNLRASSPKILLLLLHVIPHSRHSRPRPFRSTWRRYGIPVACSNVAKNPATTHTHTDDWNAHPAWCQIRQTQLAAFLDASNRRIITWHILKHLNHMKLTHRLNMFKIVLTEARGIPSSRHANYAIIVWQMLSILVSGCRQVDYSWGRNWQILDETPGIIRHRWCVAV